MTEKVKKLYKSGINNKEFLKDIKKADKDNKPTIFSNSLVKHLFTATYYGWLVGKYGNKWKEHI